jgi:2-C-methyl-D-erythritol 4-phosphate cytidylyltransferase
VLETPDRASLFAVQTPQVFYTERISAASREALEKGLPLTDDCSAAEAMGMEVHLTPGDEENMKITTPFDLVIGEAILKRREQP